MEYLSPRIGHWGYALPRLLLAGLLDTLTVLVAARLNHSRLSWFFYYPPLIFVAPTIIYPGLIGTFFIPA
jgi:hypothetical protein